VGVHFNHYCQFTFELSFLQSRSMAEVVDS